MLIIFESIFFRNQRQIPFTYACASHMEYFYAAGISKEFPVTQKTGAQLCSGFVLRSLIHDNGMFAKRAFHRFSVIQISSYCGSQMLCSGFCWKKNFRIYSLHSGFLMHSGFYSDCNSGCCSDYCSDCNRSWTFSFSSWIFISAGTGVVFENSKVLFIYFCSIYSRRISLMI